MKKLNDQHIVELYWQRDESALQLTAACYGAALTAVAQRILGDRVDSEETVNDTYLRAWNAIPPHRPSRLSVYLGKITRHLALDRYAALTAHKRGGGTTADILEEWRDALPDGDGDPADDLAVRDALSRFLRQLPAEGRRVFIRRYWYGDTIHDIATACHSSESRIKMMLSRTRSELKTFLEKEGIAL